MVTFLGCFLFTPEARLGFGDEMLAEIRKAVCEEVRGALLFVNPPAESHLPMPCDLRAEEQLLHLAFTGKVVVSEGALGADEFFSMLFSWLWKAAQEIQDRGDKVTLAGLMAVLDANGQAVTDSVKQEVEELFIALDDPYRLTGTPTQLRERVQEKAKGRKLIEWMGRMELDLRIGVITSEDVRQKMARWVKGAADGKSEGGHGPGVRDSRVRDVA